MRCDVRCDAMFDVTNVRCDAMFDATNVRCDAMFDATNVRCDAMFDAVRCSTRCDVANPCQPPWAASTKRKQAGLVQAQRLYNLHQKPRNGHRTSHHKISTSLQLVTEVVNPLRHSGVHGRAIQHNVGRQQKWRTDGWSSIVGCHHKIHGIANNSCWQEQRASRTRVGAGACACVHA